LSVSGQLVNLIILEEGKEEKENELSLNTKWRDHN